MLSEIITVVIEQPFDEVYGFLADPMNFPSWGPVSSVEIHHMHGSDWLIQMPRGPLIIRFTEPNLYGVLDYIIFGPGETSGAPVPVRLIPHGPHSELMVVWRQRPAVDEAGFSGEVGSVRGYLARLKALLEAEPMG